MSNKEYPHNDCLKALALIRMDYNPEDGLYSRWIYESLSYAIKRIAEVDHFNNKRDWGKTSGEYLTRKSQLDIARHFAEWQRKKDRESGCEVNFTTKDEDLEEEVHKHLLNIGATIEMYSGNVMGLDLCEDDYVDFARHFAQWQKEQMMKDAMEAKVSFGQIVLQEKSIQTSVAKDGDCIKVIILKTE